MAEKKETPGSSKAEAIKHSAAEASGTGRTADTTTPGINPATTSGINPRGAEDAGRFDEIKPEERDTVARDELRKQQLRDTGAATTIRGAVNRAPDESEELFIKGFGFDLYDLKNLYANIRDGNYFSAVKIAVGILNNNFNPPTLTGAAARRAQAPVPVRAAEVDEVCEQLEQYATHIEEHASRSRQLNKSKSTPVGASQERGIGLVDPDTIGVLVRLIVNLIKGCRDNNGVS